MSAKRRPYPADVQTVVEEHVRGSKKGPIRLPLAQWKEVGQRKQAPLEAIRSFCVACMGGSKSEVDRCTSVGCDLFFFRSGSSGWVDAEARERIVSEGGSE